jgi:hypothetical protein
MDRCVSICGWRHCIYIYTCTYIVGESEIGKVQVLNFALSILWTMKQFPGYSTQRWGCSLFRGEAVDYPAFSEARLQPRQLLQRLVCCLYCILKHFKFKNPKLSTC